tara:strand:+ start:367 stop:729 length:363 start_codon:yes stop_codon:yes gene_type:complete
MVEVFGNGIGGIHKVNGKGTRDEKKERDYQGIICKITVEVGCAYANKVYDNEYPVANDHCPHIAIQSAIMAKYYGKCQYDLYKTQHHHKKHAKKGYQEQDEVNYKSPEIDLVDGFHITSL